MTQGMSGSTPEALETIALSTIDMAGAMHEEGSSVQVKWCGLRLT